MAEKASANATDAEATAQQLIFDFRECGFNEVDTALCDYAVALTLDPGAMRQSHLETLKQKGLSDAQITVATQVIGYFNYINRIADGLGVELEDWMTNSFEDWMEQKPNWRSM